MCIDNRDKFWRDIAREAWVRMACFARITDPNATMLDVYRLAQVGLIEEADDDPRLAMVKLWQAMKQSDDGYVSSFGVQMLSMDERTRANILAAARRDAASEAFELAELLFRPSSKKDAQ